MATIGFFMLPQPGHLNGPMKLAKSLKAHGHKVVFFGRPELDQYICREELPSIHTFEAFDQRESQMRSLYSFILRMIGNGEAMSADLQTLLTQGVEAAFAKEERESAKRELNRTIARIKEAKPDLLFTDYYLLQIAFVMRKIGINSAILNPTLFESRYSEYPLIDFPSVLKMPVVYLCPRELDFPYVKPKEYPCYYIGPSVDLNRTRGVFSWGLMREDRPLLFCSFGSQSRVYSAAKRVLCTVIDMMTARPEWQMVLSIVDPLKVEDFDSIPPNVLLLNMAPQLEVLKRASVMITHGGLNSIKECILFGVPMVVIPFDNDQPLNAARVVYHGLGLSENPATISVNRLDLMVERIEKDPSFKTRTELMGNRFREAEKSDIGVKTVMELLKRPNDSAHFL